MLRRNQSIERERKKGRVKFKYDTLNSKNENTEVVQNFLIKNNAIIKRRKRSALSLSVNNKLSFVLRSERRSVVVLERSSKFLLKVV